MKKLAIAVCTGLLLLVSVTNSFGHSGGTDKYG